MNLTQQLAEQSQQLRELWTALVGQHLPTEQQFRIWLSMFDAATVKKAVERTAIWSMKTPGKTIEDHIRYASGVMANSKRDAAASFDGRKAVSRG